MDGLSFLGYVIAGGLIIWAAGYVLIFGFFIVVALVMQFWPLLILAGLFLFALRDEMDTGT